MPAVDCFINKPAGVKLLYSSAGKQGRPAHRGPAGLLPVMCHAMAEVHVLRMLFQYSDSLRSLVQQPCLLCSLAEVSQS